MSSGEYSSSSFAELLHQQQQPCRVAAAAALQAAALLQLGSSEAKLVVAILSYISDPGEGLIATFLDDFEVADGNT